MKNTPSAAAIYGPRIAAYALSAFVVATLGPVLMSPHVAFWQRGFGVAVIAFFCYMFFRSAARWQTFFGGDPKR